MHATCQGGVLEEYVDGRCVLEWFFNGAALDKGVKQGPQHAGVLWVGDGCRGGGGGCWLGGVGVVGSV